MADPRRGAEQELPVDRPRRPPRTIDGQAMELPRVHADANTTAALDAAQPSDVADANAASRHGWMPPRDRSPRIVPARLDTTALIVAVAVLAAAAMGLALWPRPRSDSDSDSIMRRVAGIEAQQQDAAAAQAAKSDELSILLAKLASQAPAPSRPEGDSALGERLAALEAQMKPIADRLDELDRRLRDAASAVSNPVERGVSAGGEAGDPRTTGTAQPQSEPTIAALAGRLDALQTALKSAQEQVAGAAEAGIATDIRLRGAVIAAALRLAVERGYPFTTELATARTNGLDPATLALLEPFAATGVPSQVELFRELSALVPALLRASAPAASNAPVNPAANRIGNYFERLQGGAEKLVHIRPVGDAPDDDPPTPIGRVELAMTHRDVAAVAAELDKLPPAASTLAEPWRKKALAREAAFNAAHRMASALLSKLVEAPVPNVQLR